MTSEGRALRNLLSSTNLRDATAAFGGFERPAGFSFADPQAMHNWTGRLQFAEQALRDFGNRTSGVTGNLGRFGDGLGSAVTSLAQGSNSLAGTASDFAGQSKGLLGQLTGGLRNLFSRLENAGGGSFGAGGNWLASLFGGSQLGIALSGGVGLYNTGGFTGTGDPAQPAGIVHAQEFVFDAPAVRRLGVPFLEALRSGEAPGYRDGGVVSATPLPFPAGGSAGNGFANPANGIGEISRVGTMDCSIAPLTEPDMRTTHPALWIGPSKCQLKLGRYLRGVKFHPSGFQRYQSSCEPGNRIGPRHARTVGLVPNTPAAIRGTGGSPAARPHCQKMPEKEAGSLLLTHDDSSQPTADMSVEYTQSLDTLFRAEPEVRHPPVEVAAETRHTR